MTLGEALEEFKTVHMPARNLAARTRIEYTNDLTAFIDYLESLGVARIGDLSIIHIDRYLARLDELGYSGATRKRKAITFRAFLAFLFRNGHLSQDISQKVILPFANQPMPRVLTHNEYNRLLDACAGHPRDKSIITLLLQTGIRLSELTRLTMSDIHLPESIDIQPSGSRPGRTITLNSKACEALQGYFTTRPASTILFPSKSGKPLGNRGVEKIIEKHLWRVGIGGASVHSLRHTFGVQHIKKGTNLKTIQAVLGHQDSRTMEKYINLAQEIKKKELEDHAL